MRSFIDIYKSGWARDEQTATQSNGKFYEKDVP